MLAAEEAAHPAMLRPLDDPELTQAAAEGALRMFREEWRSLLPISVKIVRNADYDVVFVVTFANHLMAFDKETLTTKLLRTVGKRKDLWAGFPGCHYWPDDDTGDFGWRFDFTKRPRRQPEETIAEAV